MAIIVKPFTFSAGAVIIASQHNSDYDTIFSDYNGNIDNNNIAPGAAIVASKLDLTTGSAIGTTTPAAGKFTTLEATSTFKVGTTHQGDIFYDNGTSIVRLTPGTSGQFLKTLGASANPAWATFTATTRYTSSDTFVAPTGITQVFLTMQAQGGGGAGGDGGANGGGGGASGQGVWMMPYKVTGGNSYTVTINSSGAGGAQGVDGTGGGSVVFDAITMAGGGGGVKGGSGGTGGTVTIGVSTLMAASGATAGIQGYYILGQAGGNKSGGSGGGGAGSMLGAGGNGSVSNNVPATTAGNYGGGGGGGQAIGSTGGTGGPGVVIVSY